MMFDPVTMQVLFLLIFFDYYYINTYLLNKKKPIWVLNIGTYAVLFKVVSNVALIEENMLKVLFFSGYVGMLVFLINFVNKYEKKDHFFFSLLFTLLLLFYLSCVNKLEVFSINLAFASMVWYCLLGMRIFTFSINKYVEYFSYDIVSVNNNEFFSVFCYNYIQFLFYVKKYQQKIVQTFLVRMFISLLIWLLIYKLKSLTVFFLINVILTVFLFLNSLFIYFLNDFNTIVVFYNNLDEKKYLMFVQYFRELSTVEKNFEAKERQLIFCRLMLSLVRNITVVFDNFFKTFNQLAEKNNIVGNVDSLFIKYFNYIISKKYYGRFFFDERVLSILYTAHSQDELEKTMFFEFILNLDFYKKKLLNHYWLELNGHMLLKANTSSSLLVIKMPTWYINIKFPLINS